MGEKIVHFDTGGYWIGTVSGSHSEMLCGISLQDNNLSDNDKKSTDKTKITCKRCLKKLAKRGN